MRNGKNILRLQADEEDVYHLMDLRERYFVLIGAGSLIEGIAAYFLFFQIRCWDLIYLCAALFLGIFLLLRQSNKISKRIMEAEICYMELDEFSLAVCQPEKNGHYECCRIFYEEIDRMQPQGNPGILHCVGRKRKPGELFPSGRGRAGPDDLPCPLVWI